MEPAVCMTTWVRGYRWQKLATVPQWLGRSKSTEQSSMKVISMKLEGQGCNRAQYQ